MTGSVGRGRLDAAGIIVTIDQDFREVSSGRGRLDAAGVMRVMGLDHVAHDVAMTSRVVQI